MLLLSSCYLCDIEVSYLGSLQANSGQTRFLLVGSMGVSQPSVLNPNIDPVHMAISCSKTSGSHNSVLVIIPGMMLMITCMHEWLSKLLPADSEQISCMVAHVNA